MTINDLQLKKFKAIINSDYPDFDIKSIKTLKAGWDNFVVEVNKEYIFRFPKNKDFSLDNEVKILKSLKDRITLDIPVYEYIGKGSLFVGYKKIVGSPLSLNAIKLLDSKSRSILEKDIATFLYEFHSALPIKKTKSLGLKKDSHYWRPLVIKKKVIGKLKNQDLSDFIEMILGRYLDANQDNSDLVVAYNDLHGNNLAFDKKKMKLKGIFDFSDVAIENVAREFCSLFSLDQKLAIGIIKKYEKLSGRSVKLEQVFINAVIGEASILGVFMDKPDSQNYKYALNDLLQLKKISNKFIKYNFKIKNLCFPLKKSLDFSCPNF